MSHRFSLLLLSLTLACLSLSNTGCVHLTEGNSLGLLAIPIPVSPYFQKIKEDEFWDAERV